VESVNNSKKFDSIKEDKGIIDEHGTHMMPLAKVINWDHLFHDVLPIHTHEDLYMV
jgi:hypothetical protein